MSTQPLIKERYKLIRVIGKGGWGVVHLAEDIQGGNREVAVKQVKMAGIPQQELKGMMNEISLLKSLSHENIVQYIDSLQTTTEFYIILEFVDRGSLSDILRNTGRFSEKDIAIYMSQVLCGLQYLHEQGVIHRDIKGANILSTKDGVIKLADFGVATKGADDTVIGTPYWMAPEIIELQGASTKSDIWSVGCTVIELLTGKPPYFDLAQMTALFRIVQDETPPLPEASPPCLDFLRNGCFKKQVNFRKSAEDLLQHKWIKNNQLEKKGGAPAKEDPKKKVTGGATKDSPKPATPKDKTKPDEKKTKSGESDKTKKHTTGDKKAAHNKKKSTSSKSSGHGSSGTTKKTGTVKKDKDHNKDKHHHKNTTGKKDLAGSLDKKSQKLKKDSPPPKLAVRTVAKSASNESSDDWDSPQPIPKIPQQSESSDDWDAPKVQAPKINLPTQSTEAGKGDGSSSDWDSPRKPSVPSQSLAALFKQLKDTSSEDDWDNPKAAGLASNLAKLKPGGGGPLAGLSWDSSSDETPIKPPAPSKQPETPGPAAPQSNLKKALEILADNKESESDSDSWGEFTGKFGKDDEAADDILAILKKKRNFEVWDDESSSEEDDDDFARPTTSNNQDYHDKILVNQVSEKIDASISQILLKSANTKQLCEDLVQIFSTPQNQEQKAIFKQKGVVPLIEMLEVSSIDNIHSILQVIHAIIKDYKEIQQTFQIMAAIPALLQFWGSKPGTTDIYSNEVREETVTIFENMFKTIGDDFLGNFISNGALPAIRGLLEPTSSYQSNKRVCLYGIEMIYTVLNTKASLGVPLKKNDYCRLWARAALFPALNKTLQNVVNDSDTAVRDKYSFLISEILVEVSRTDNVVRRIFADSVEPILAVWEKLPSKPLLNILKAFKEFSQEPSSLEILQKHGAIPKILSLLASRNTNPSITPMHTSYLVQTLYQLCIFCPSRQSEAVKGGMIPHLKELIDSKSTCKDFALPVLCEIAHSKDLIEFLWEHDMCNYYIKLFEQEAWQEHALKAIAVWSSADPRVSHALVQGKNIKRLHTLFKNFTSAVESQSSDQIEAFSASFESIVVSKEVVLALINNQFVPTLKDTIPTMAPVARLKLVKVLSTIYEHAPNKQKLMNDFALKAYVKNLEASDPAVMVRKVARDLAIQMEEAK